jgi:hypothetical protein
LPVNIIFVGMLITSMFRYVSDIPIILSLEHCFLCTSLWSVLIFYLVLGMDRLLNLSS